MPDYIEHLIEQAKKDIEKSEKIIRDLEKIHNLQVKG